MKLKLFFGGCIFLFLGGILFLFLYQRGKTGFISPLAVPQKIVLEKPLEKYSFSRLQKTEFLPSEITIGKKIKDEQAFSSYLFHFYDNGKKVSGLLHLPTEKGTYPVVVMFRGFVDKSIYEPGVGTSRAGEVFAQNGFITLAPDFLGYGSSDNPSQNSMEERFQTYTTAVTLLLSIPNVNSAFSKKNIGISADSAKLAIWGHSNGGHIAIAALEITKKSYPTVLWAPVTKPFPYSILYYTDEFEDHGKSLRKVLADFEKDYDVEKYSPTNYFDAITAPILLFQGDTDDAIPVVWSEQFVQELKEKEKDIEFVLEHNADHNLMPEGWNNAVQKSIEFYREKLK